METPQWDSDPKVCWSKYSSKGKSQYTATSKIGKCTISKQVVNVPTKSIKLQFFKVLINTSPVTWLLNRLNQITVIRLRLHFALKVGK